MDTSSHIAILKRTGAVLVGVGLLDVGVMIYCVANGVAYSSSFNLLSIIAGIFLLRGSLRAAATVRWFATLMLAAFLTLALAWPFIQPIDLTLTEMRLNPLSSLGSLVFMVLVLCLLYWLNRELGRAPVLQASAAAGRKARDMRLPFASGVGIVVVLVVLLSVLMNGESGAKARAMAEQELGAAYLYHVSSLNIVANSQGTFVSGTVTAWNEKEVRDVPVSWEEH